MFQGTGIATNLPVHEAIKNKHGAKSSSKLAFLKLHGDRFLFFKTYVKIGMCLLIDLFLIDLDPRLIVIVQF